MTRDGAPVARPHCTYWSSGRQPGEKRPAGLAPERGPDCPRGRLTGKYAFASPSEGLVNDSAVSLAWEERGLIRAVRLPSGVRRFRREDIDGMRNEMFSGFLAPRRVDDDILDVHVTSVD